MRRILQNSVLCDGRYAFLIEDLDRAKHDLDLAYAKLANALDPDLIDCYIYEVQSVQMRYKFLLHRIKQIEDAQGTLAPAQYPADACKGAVHLKPSVGVPR